MCADLVSPENATISYDPDMTPPFRDIGTVASYTCDDGFALVGAETRECLSGTTWTGDDPSCQRKRFCKIPAQMLERESMQ